VTCGMKPPPGGHDAVAAWADGLPGVELPGGSTSAVNRRETSQRLEWICDCPRGFNRGSEAGSSRRIPGPIAASKRCAGVAKDIIGLPTMRFMMQRPNHKRRKQRIKFKNSFICRADGNIFWGRAMMTPRDSDPRTPCQTKCVADPTQWLVITLDFHNLVHFSMPFVSGQRPGFSRVGPPCCQVNTGE